MNRPDLINRTELVALMERILARLKADPDVSASCVTGYQTALDEVKCAVSVKTESAA